MKTFAVGCVKPLNADTSDKKLIVENIRAINWIEALKKHSLLKKETKEVQAVFKDVSICDPENAKKKAFCNNWMFEVIEVIEPMRPIELIEYC